jgi:thiamine transport system substrate-binding protein
MKIITLCLFVLVTLLSACGSGAGENELLVMSHDSFDISEEVLAEFEEANDVKITLLPAGDTGAALNQAILTREDPLADIFYGVDNTFLSRALDADIFERYSGANLDDIQEDLILDPSYRLMPVDYGDVCLNYDIKWFEDHGLEPPQALSDLTSPEYAGLLVVENPATSSPGLAFLLATIDAFGSEGGHTYLDFWRDLRENELLVVDGWEDAYYGQFSASGDGDRPLVVSYASSPPAEVIFADPPINEAPTASVSEPGTCFRQVEFAGILKGTNNQKVAEAFIDFVLGVRFQEDIPLHMFVFPANQQAKLPDVFADWADIPSDPAQIDPKTIDLNRETWIEDWTDVVLR